MGNFMNKGPQLVKGARQKRGWDWGEETAWQTDKKKRHYYINTIYNETIDPWYIPQLKKRWAATAVFIYWYLIWAPPWLMGKLYTSPIAHMRNWHDRWILWKDIPALGATQQEQVRFERESGQVYPRPRQVSFYDKLEQLEVESSYERAKTEDEARLKRKLQKEAWEKAISETTKTSQE
eukprot:TRINITY_DN9272_c0_g1_i1.p1 TRINITY_DN9272_c0_g1~~TRINITY_DN9272_c0_g1_i1.p1  ORF type:complete len:179 (+),score=12.71 TRINITY_DN9272_c0_g1_i1:3-539(+)